MRQTLLLVLLGMLAGCARPLTSRDQVPEQIVVGCNVSSNGETVVVYTTLESATGALPMLLAKGDAFFAHDAQGKVAMSSFVISANYSGDDLTEHMGYEATFSHANAPRVGLLLDNRAIQWVELSLPSPPVLSFVSGPNPRLTWDPSPDDALALFADCTDRKPRENQEYPTVKRTKKDGPFTLPIAKDSGTLDVARLYELMQISNDPQAPNCRSIRVVASRSRTVSIPKLGVNAKSVCQLNQVRAMTFERSIPVQ